MNRKNRKSLLLLITALLILSLSSCDPSSKYAKEEQAKIQDFLASNPTMAFELKPSGLYYLEVLAGTGITPVTHDTAYVMYTGKFLDGTIFDSNVETGDTLIFPVNEGWLMYGFDEGVTYMKEGGTSTLLIPSNLAFGSSGFYTIPGYTPVLYDLNLVRIKPGPGPGNVK